LIVQPGCKRLSDPGRAGRVLLAVLLILAVRSSARAEELLWFANERPTAQAWAAIAILEAAGDEGLRPEKYDPLSLRHAFATAEQGVVPAPEARAELDQRLTRVMIAYLRDLHSGQIDPRLIRENFSFQPLDGFDPLRVLLAAVRDQRLPEAVREAAPALPLYANLRLALAHYRKIAADPVTEALWRTPLPAVQPKLEPGQPYEGLPILTLRLVTLGDLSCNTLAPKLYTGAVVEAVKTFQTRHGLNPDGIIGKQTLERLNVSPATRVRQIELAMERLRWTPLLHAPRMVAINVPEHILEAYEVRDGTPEVQTSMRVIIGKALDMRTPLFDEAIRFIEFSPYWNVPPSIARSEVIPAIRRDPGYFERQGFEFVAADGHVIPTLAPEHLDEVLLGRMRIRQRPGPKNSLGDIKFVFPNKDNIYLHYTPSPGLFERDRRDLSHGCVRIQDPVGLAKFVLKNEPDWTEERIRAAMQEGTSKTLRLRNPVRVLIAYNTVRIRDGLVHFFADIYGQDKALDQALGSSRQTVQ
jgi:murein L,D-transpeptidase YcbB/YkuD